MKHLALLVLPLAFALRVQAGGTIQLANTSLTRVTWLDTVTPVPTTPGLVFYGVKWGTNAAALNLAPKFATNSTSQAGLISAPFVFDIPGTTSGQTVYLQVIGWRACDATTPDPRFGCEPYGETDIRLVTLGQEVGPGTVIWQSATGSNPGRFHPLVLGAPLTPAAMIAFYDSPLGAPLTVDEGARGMVDIPIRLLRTSFPFSGGSLHNVTTTVWLTTSNGTALGGQDFEPGAESITFGPGESFKVGHVRLLADSEPESLEQFQVHLRLAGGYRAEISSTPLSVNIREARVVAARVETNQFVVAFETSFIQRYALESSVDLSTWSGVPGAQEIQGTGRTIEVRDPAFTCCAPRFYRTRILP